MVTVPVIEIVREISVEKFLQDVENALNMSGIALAFALGTFALLALFSFMDNKEIDKLKIRITKLENRKDERDS